METLHPRDATDVAAMIAEAAEKKRPLAPFGHGSKKDFGRPVDAVGLDMSALSGVTLYEPSEMVLSAQAGTPMAEIERTLARANQMLAFEPPDYGPLFGGLPGHGTVGGIVGCNLSGPRRVSLWAARDHVLGLSGVSGRGELFKAGGRVVKNVTGFDLPKLLTGSFGALAVLTDITLRVRPAPGTARTVVLAGLCPRRAGAALTQALGGAQEISGAVYLDRSLSLRSKVKVIATAAASVILLRLEGPAPSVAWRAEALKAELASFAPAGEMGEVGEENSRLLWRELRDISYFAADDLCAHFLWRVCLPPAEGGAFLDRIRQARPNAEGMLDWGGGLVWIALPPSEDADASLIRMTLADAGGGHATLLRASDDVRRKLRVFQPMSEAEAILTRRVKGSFDPASILNPGRMYEGI